MLELLSKLGLLEILGLGIFKKGEKNEFSNKRSKKAPRLESF